MNHSCRCPPPRKFNPFPENFPAIQSRVQPKAPLSRRFLDSQPTPFSLTPTCVAFFLAKHIPSLSFSRQPYHLAAHRAPALRRFFASKTMPCSPNLTCVESPVANPILLPPRALATSGAPGYPPAATHASLSLTYVAPLIVQPISPPNHSPEMPSDDHGSSWNHHLLASKHIPCPLHLTFVAPLLTTPIPSPIPLHHVMSLKAEALWTHETLPHNPRLAHSHALAWYASSVKQLVPGPASNHSLPCQADPLATPNYSLEFTHTVSLRRRSSKFPEPSPTILPRVTPDSSIASLPTQG